MSEEQPVQTLCPTRGGQPAGTQASAGLFSNSQATPQSDSESHLPRETGAGRLLTYKLLRHQMDP